MKSPKWYHYLITGIAALFLTNTIPHFVKGICGDPFPTSFSDPLVNILWALANLVIGYILLRLGCFPWKTRCLPSHYWPGWPLPL